MNIVKPQAVFFDWDGTLVDTFSFLQAAHNDVMSSLGLTEIDRPDWFSSYFGKSRDFIYGSLYGDKRLEAMALFEKFVEEQRKAFLKPIEGAHEFLSLLQEQGVPACVVSNKKTGFIHAEIQLLRWEGYFEAVIGAGDASADKPSCAPFWLAKERSGIAASPEAIWFIGDTEADLACAQSAKAVAVFFDYLKSDPVWAKAYNPAMVVSDYLPLRRILKADA